MAFPDKKQRKNKNAKLSNKGKEHFKHDHMDLRRIKREKRKNDDKKDNANDDGVKSNKIAKSEDRSVKRDLKSLRKTMKNKTFYETATEIKRIWEDLRKIGSTKSEEGQRLAE